MSVPVEVALLRSRKFAPLFVVNLLGIFNDNLMKTALLVLGSYRLFSQAPQTSAELAMAAGILFIVPFFLFSALAGEIADTFERVGLVRLTKFAEVAALLLAAYGFWVSSVPVLLTAMFLMGVHSSMFGPLKYALLPDSVPRSELVSGTGLMEGGGFLAIIAGQLIAELIPQEVVGVVTVCLALVGLAASFLIPRRAVPAVRGRIDLNPIRSSIKVVKRAMSDKTIFWCVLAIAWFYAVGAVLLSQMITLVESVFHAKPEVAALLLSIFSVGVAAGSILVGRWLKGAISPKFAAPSAILIGVALLDFGHTVASASFDGQGLGLMGFLARPISWRIIFDLALTSVAGGVFVIPLYALLQACSPEAERARILAGNNILNALISTLTLAAAGLLVGAGMPLTTLILILAVATLVVGVCGFLAAPGGALKAALRFILKSLYRPKVEGLQNMPPEGVGAVVVANHLSYLDGLFLAVFLPGRPVFAVHSQVAATWRMKVFSKLVETFPVDTTNPMSTKAMAKVVKSGRTLVIFPEGRITRTGALMKVFAGPALIADKAGALIVPVHLDGLQFSPFSHMKGTLRLVLFPKVRITILSPASLNLADDASPRIRRARAAERLYQLMTEAAFWGSRTQLTLPEALLEASRRHGEGAMILEDVKRQPLTYERLIIGVRVLASVFEGALSRDAHVGVMLPNINAHVVTLFALQACGKTPALLNYTTGERALLACCRTANLASVVTSRGFVEKAKLQAQVQAMEAAKIRVLYLEDLTDGVGRLRKFVVALGQKLFPKARLGSGTPDDPALILFTSGSEGAPKGVVLTHRNLLSNCSQITARIDFNPSDCVLNALPMFHSFGLTGGTLLPLLSGVRTILYPNPLHYATVTALAYDASATILFGADTFLAGYARSAEPYDFYSLRYIFAGAEPVKPETRKVFSEKFGLRIFEGYGATECSPVIALNTPMHCREGSVGQALPGLELRIDPVEGVDKGGRLHLRGPNIMAGYLEASAPLVIQPPLNGWHDTGDIVEIDEDGYIFIRGRAKRFVKIGGEMISLAALEGFAGEVWPDDLHAMVARPHATKGEEVVLLTTSKTATRQTLLAWAQRSGVSELWIPAEILPIQEMPMLATGKINYADLGRSVCARAPKHKDAA